MDHLGFYYVFSTSVVKNGKFGLRCYQRKGRVVAKNTRGLSSILWLFKDRLSLSVSALHHNFHLSKLYFVTLSYT